MIVKMIAAVMLLLSKAKPGNNHNININNMQCCLTFYARVLCRHTCDAVFGKCLRKGTYVTCLPAGLFVAIVVIVAVVLWLCFVLTISTTAANKPTNKQLKKQNKY
jgi:hypothetical protein